MTLEEEVKVLKDKVALLEKIIELKEDQPVTLTVMPYVPYIPYPWNPAPSVPWCTDFRNYASTRCNSAS